MSQYVRTAPVLAEVCQVRGDFTNPVCTQREPSGYLCERIDAHGDTGHAFGRHTIEHARMGNGYTCTAIDPPFRGELPLTGQVLASTDFVEPYDSARLLNVDTQQANLITSLVAGSSMHKPVLDIDLPVTLLPSSTPGHFHLFIDKEMTWSKYSALLEALAAAGLIERGYADASVHRGHTAVRLPWVRKDGGR